MNADNQRCRQLFQHAEIVHDMKLHPRFQNAHADRATPILHETVRPGVIQTDVNCVTACARRLG